MDAVNKTLYIPLYGKAYVSQRGIILCDEKAEEIWAREGFPLKGKSKSKWLAYYMGMRAAVFDDWLKKQIANDEDALVIHVGCGLDSRVLRVNAPGRDWYDVDFPEVIQERRRYYSESECYHMIGGDIRNAQWLSHIPGNRNAILVMEGVSMYLSAHELKRFMALVSAHFSGVQLLMDCYSPFAAKASRFKNPIKDVGVTSVYGIDEPKVLEEGTGMRFARAHDMTPAHLIAQLDGAQKVIFSQIYGGKLAGMLYQLYEFHNG